MLGTNKSLYQILCRALLRLVRVLMDNWAENFGDCSLLVWTGNFKGYINVVHLIKIPWTPPGPLLVMPLITVMFFQVNTSTVASMLNKKDLAKLRKHLKKDKVLRTQTFLLSNKLSADTVVESDGGTLMHLVCKMVAENVFWAVRRGARPSIYLAKDKHGRTPCHYAAINLIKTSKMSGKFVRLLCCMCLT